MMNKVQKLTQNPEIFKAYQAWCRDEITELVMESMLEMMLAENATQPIKMVGQQGVSIEVNALENARTKGMYDCLARMVSFSNEQAKEMPPENYAKPWSGQVEQGGDNQ